MEPNQPTKFMNKINKNHCALLIIDMQEYFRAMAEPILPDLFPLIECCRQVKLPVIFTRHAHKDPLIDGGMLAKWWGEMIIDGTSEAEILDELKPRKNEKIIPKNRYTAFFQTDLHRHLQKCQIQQVIISGVMTNLCCETTARDAFVHDYEVFFLTDGTATSREDFHRATLLNLSYGFAHLKTCHEIYEAITLS